ncbi:MAG: methionyl-tRNA formyltransferase, partial [Planctomycetota bacterium]
MKVIFLGTPEFSGPILRGLVHAGHKVAAVFTMCDKAAGRGRKIVSPQVKTAAEKLNLPVYQFPKISSPEGVSAIRETKAELGVVAAFGEIISKEVLQSLPYGFLNVHASILPRWRGAAPVQHAILAGDKETGVTIIKMVEKMDAGPILVQAETKIDKNETAGELSTALSKIGAQAIVAALTMIEQGHNNCWIEQDKS